MCILLFLVRFELSYDLFLGDLFAEVSGDISVTYYLEGVGAFDTLV